MSAALGADMAAPRGLGTRDPALRLLPAALPPAGSPWRLHDTAFQPGVGCRLAFLRRDGSSAASFLSIEVTATGVRAADFRQDPLLPGLAAAADPAWIAARLGAELQQPVLGCRVEPIRYRPGARCVLRYWLRTPSGEHVLVGKVLGGAAFDRTARHLTLLDGSRAGRELVAPTIAVWPDVHMVVSAAVLGRSVSAILGDGAVPPPARVQLGHRLGDLLARLHAVPDVAAPTCSISAHLAALLDDMPAVRSLDVDLARRLSALLDVLTEDVPQDATWVLGHGAFRAGQVLRAGDGGLVALDVDDLCRCPPGRDLGTVLGHLRWQAVRLPAERETLLEAGRAVLSGYRDGGGVIDSRSLLWWRAAGMLQVAMRRYRRLEVGDWPLVPALLDAATDALMTRRAPASRGAPDLLDLGRMTVVLRLALAGIARSPGGLRVVAAEPQPSAVGRRAVVRYRVRGLSGDEPALLIGKWFSDVRRARLVHEHLVLLNDGPFGPGALRVPEPVALLADQGVVLYRHCAGTQLSWIGDPASAARGVRRAAAWLARLHVSSVGLPRRLTLPAEAVSARRWATVVGQAYPDLAASARGLASAWAAEATTLPVAGEVPIHKDFHPGHVLLDGETTSVIDVDEARMGDPTFDVAHFCGYLGLTFGTAAGDRLTDLFVREYTARTGWSDPGSFGPFLAYTWLKIAKQWALASGPARDASPVRRRSGAALALERGWACLSESSTSCAAGHGFRRRSS